MLYISSFLFLLAVGGSLVSQNPTYIENGTLQWLKYLWVFPFLFQLTIDFKAFVSLWCIQVFIIVFCFAFFCFSAEVFTESTYIGTDFANICMSMIIAVVSFSFWRKFGNSGVMKKLCILIAVVGFFLAYVVYTQYLADASVFDLHYAFASKNSMGQILLCCGYIPLVNYQPKRKYLRFAYYIAVLFMFFVMIMMKARATIVCGMFLLLYHVVKSNNKRLKFTFLFLGILIIILLLTIPDLYKTIVTGILLANRSDDDINSLSSGRTILISEAIKHIQENYLLGIGNSYIDCMPIAMVLQYGIIGASLVFALICVMGYYVNQLNRSSNRLNLTAFLLFLAFLINSLFEAQPPFGPGAKCFLMWIMVGFALAEDKRECSRIKNI